VQVLMQTWSVAPVWKAVVEGDVPSPPEAAECCLLVYRDRSDGVGHETISPSEARLAVGLMNGEPLAEAWSRADGGDVASMIVALMRRLDLGLVAAIAPG
jgi:hypothetical protein